MILRPPYLFAALAGACASIVGVVAPAQAEEPSSAGATAEETVEPWRERPFVIDVYLAPMLNQQQIEGPTRDDLIVNDLGISNSLSLSYSVLEWLEPGLLLQFDAGRTRHAQFSRPDPETGETTETDVVEGSYFEHWTTIFVRGRWRPFFAELGWAPLILRKDSTRTDLPNVNGETDGLFVGSRSVAWMINLGAGIPIDDNTDINLRLQYRIRYLVSRGGEDLAGEEELGNMFLLPSAGLSHRF